MQHTNVERSHKRAPSVIPATEGQPASPAQPPKLSRTQRKQLICENINKLTHLLPPQCQAWSWDAAHQFNVNIMGCNTAASLPNLRLRAMAVAHAYGVDFSTIEPEGGEE
ncbi:MAG: hypothetical protein WB542_18155 [Polaromonas sp.]